MTGNVKAVCKWIGNSPIVAMNHYAQVTEADMKEAAAVTVLKSAEKDVAKGGRCEGQNVSELSGTKRKTTALKTQITLVIPTTYRTIPNSSKYWTNKIHCDGLDSIKITRYQRKTL